MLDFNLIFLILLELIKVFHCEILIKLGKSLDKVQIHA